MRGDITMLPALTPIHTLSSNEGSISAKPDSREQIDQRLADAVVGDTTGGRQQFHVVARTRASVLVGRRIVRVLVGRRAFRHGAAFAAPVASHLVVVGGVGDGIGLNLRVLFAHGHNSAALDAPAQHPGAVVVTWMARCEPHHQMWTASATGGQ